MSKQETLWNRLIICLANHLPRRLAFFCAMRVADNYAPSTGYDPPYETLTVAEILAEWSADDD